MSDSPTRQTYRQLSPMEQEWVRHIKEAGDKLIAEIETLRALHPREHALARTKTEEAVMWAVKGITG